MDMQSLDLRRSGDRKRVIAAATLTTRAGPLKVRVRDLSPSGARLVTDGRPSPGSDALFSRADLFVACRVVWSNEKETGIQFYRSVDEIAGTSQG